MQKKNGNSNNSKLRIPISIIAQLVSLVLIDQIAKIVFAVPNAGFSFKIDGGEIGIIIINVFILFVVGKFLLDKNKVIDNRSKVAAAFIFAGGFSNLIDLIFRENVSRYLNLRMINSSFVNYAFNLADIYILVGFILFVVFLIFNVSKNKKRERMIHRYDKSEEEIRRDERKAREGKREKEEQEKEKK